MNEVKAFTDGACRGNPGPGGWGVLLQSKHGEVRELFGGERHTTNNRMELIAAIRALEALKKPTQVALYTDSQYVKNGITVWLRGWVKNGWLTSGKQPVKNKDLWLELDRLTKQHDVTWHWVRGHAGNEGNERADQLAKLGIDYPLGHP